MWHRWGNRGAGREHPARGCEGQWPAKSSLVALALTQARDKMLSKHFHRGQNIPAAAFGSSGGCGTWHRIRGARGQKFPELGKKIIQWCWVMESRLRAQPHSQSHPVHPSKAQAVPPNARSPHPLCQACCTTTFWAGCDSGFIIPQDAGSSVPPHSHCPYTVTLSLHPGLWHFSRCQPNCPNSAPSL